MARNGLYFVRVELCCAGCFVDVIFPDRQVRDVKMFISVRDHDLDTFFKKNPLYGFRVSVNLNLSIVDTMIGSLRTLFIHSKKTEQM